MKAREVILLLLIIGAGALIHEIQNGNLPFFWDFEEGIFWNAQEFDFEETLTVDPPLPGQLVVDNAHGQVDVQAGPADRITITLTKRIYRKTEAEARAAADRLRAVLRRPAGQVFVSTTRNEFKRRRDFETDFRISCPAGTALKVDNSYGKILAVGLAAASLDNSHGPVSVSDVSGPVTVVNSYEDVELLRCGSDASVESNHSRITAREVKGRLKLRQRYGTLDFSQIGGEVDIDAPHTEIIGRDASGGLTIANSYDRIRLARIGSVRVDADHSDLEAENVQGDCEVRDSYGDIRLTDIQGSVQVEGRSLSLTGRRLSGPEVRVTTSYQNVELDDFGGRAEIRISHADLALTPAALSGPLDVQGEYAGIRLHWPKGQRYPLQARSRGGRVSWTVSGPAPQTEENGTFVLKAFGDAVGQPPITLSTSYENIVIED